MSTNSGPYGDPDTRTRILTATWTLIAERGSSLKLSDVAGHAGVSRQAVYLHFGDRNGLLLALVQHMDDTLALGESLAEVFAAPNGFELLERAMQVNTEFWTGVLPVAQVLEAAQYDDEALGTAWRNRMQLRHTTFTMMIQQIADRRELADQWTIDDAAAVLYAVARFDTWRELTQHLNWTNDHYVEHFTQLLSRSLLRQA
jgi:AcrR family transcriptional regulator